MMTAGALVREVRLRHRLDQNALALRAGTSQSQISRIERGETTPGLSTLANILRAAGEDLVVASAPAAGGNASTAELQATLRTTTPAERVAEAASLSRLLTGIAAGRRR